MEKRDLYNENKELTGEIIYKGEKIPKGRFIKVVLIYIQNSSGKFLIQKRSKIKNGLYATTGGHPKFGETSLEGILTEVEEEIGLKLQEKDIIWYHGGISEKERVIWDDYYIKLDIDNIENLNLQKEEVESIYWFSKEEIEKLNKEGKFFKNHYEEFQVLMKKKFVI